MTADMKNQAPPGPRALRRTTERRQVAGVAAGLARHFDLSPSLVRLGFVVLAFTGGFGVLLYILGWLLIPEEGKRRSMAEQAFSDDDNSDSTLAFVLAGLAVVIMLGSFNFFSGGMIVAAGLFAAGLLLYRNGGRDERPAVRNGREAESADGPVAAASYLDAAHAEIAEIADPPLGEYEQMHSFLDEPVAAPPPVRPRRSYLGRLTLAFALVAVGVLASLDSVGVVDAGLSDYVAAVLAVIGVGLIFGAVAGRARWLILPGLMLVPMLLAASLISVPLSASYGEFDLRPTTFELLESSYEFGGADVTLDLTQLPALDADRTVNVDMGGGQLQIILPADENVVVDTDVGAGEIVVSEGAASASIVRGADDRAGVFVEQRYEQIHGEGPVLELVVDVAFGSVQIDVVER